MDVCVRYGGGVLRFGVQAAPKVQRVKGRGWGRLLVTARGEEPRRQGHTPSKRWCQIEDGDSSAAVAGWIVLVVGSFGGFRSWLVRHRRSKIRRQFRELQCCGLRRKMSKICDLGVACCEPFGRSVGHSSCPRGLLIP